MFQRVTGFVAIVLYALVSVIFSVESGCEL